MECTCKKIPLVNKVKGSKVTAYTVSGDCPYCIAQRKSNAIEQAEQDKKEEVEKLISDKQRKLAEDALISENVLQKTDGILEKVEE